MGRSLAQSELENFPSLEWTEIAPRLTPAVRSALETVLTTQDGSSLSRDECSLLANSEGDDLIGLLVAANELRAELAGNLVTYVVNRNINFTNICFVGCKFCAFSRGPREHDTYFLSLDQVARKAEEAWALGATEVCIQGGLPHDLPPFYYRDILRAVKRAVPRMHCHAFSPMEIVYGVELTGMPIADYLSMLRDNGLDTLPGTAAEILDDEVRAVLSRNKLSTEQWKEVITTAHELGIRSTSTLMYGHVETPEHWVNQILLFRDIQKRTGGFTEFVPLGFVHQNTLLFHQGLARSGPTPRRTPEDSCAGARSASWLDQQHPGFVGQVEPQTLATLPASGRKRLRRHPDGREYFARSGRHRRVSTPVPRNSSRSFSKQGRIPAERNTIYTRIHIKSPLEELTSEQACAEFA